MFRTKIIKYKSPVGLKRFVCTTKVKAPGTLTRANFAKLKTLKQMKKFQGLGKSLDKSEQKKIKGGEYGYGGEGQSVVRGECSGGSSGAWTYTSPVWYLDCWNDIDRYCGSGEGYCYTS